MEFPISLKILALAALIPLITGFIWYSKFLFANAWMRSANLSEEDLKKPTRILLIFLATYLLSFFLAFAMNGIAIHQSAIFSILADDPQMGKPGSASYNDLLNFMSKYGKNFRTFKHGFFHGVEFTIVFVIPVLGIIAMFERRPFKWVMIHAGYWALTLALMGGVICQFT